MNKFKKGDVVKVARLASQYFNITYNAAMSALLISGESFIVKEDATTAADGFRFYEVDHYFPQGVSKNNMLFEDCLELVNSVANPPVILPDEPVSKISDAQRKLIETRIALRKMLHGG